MKGPSTWTLSLSLFILLLTSCGRSPAPARLEGWKLRPAHFAKHFRVWARGEERLLITFGPGGQQDTLGVYDLSPTGDYACDISDAIPIAVPLNRIALRSSTHAPFISALGRADAVVGCAQADQLRDMALAERRDAGLLLEIADGVGLDLERLTVLRPEVLFSYPFGRTVRDIPVSGPATVEVGEYLEPDPLGRAEWLRVFGLFLGKERLADSLFDSIAARYDSVRRAVPKDADRPTVFFGSSWKGNWSVPAGNSYMAKLVADAGARYLFADQPAPGNIEIDIETILTIGAQAEYWGRILAQDRPVTDADVAGDDARILALPAFTGHRCFSANSAVDDLFGQAVLEPDVVLSDLVGIFHPSLAQGRSQVYFKPVQ